MSGGEPVEVGKHPLDDSLVRSTVEEVRESASRARRTEVALVILACSLMVLVAGFTGYNTYRLRTINRNLTSLVISLGANQEVQHTYNEAHANSASTNFQALVDNIRCFTDFFVEFNRAVSAGEVPPDKAILDACFKPVAPGPPAQKLPSENDKAKR